jgi:hypothetical protein
MVDAGRASRLRSSVARTASDSSSSRQCYIDPDTGNSNQYGHRDSNRHGYGHGNPAAAHPHSDKHAHGNGDGHADFNADTSGLNAATHPTAPHEYPANGFPAAGSLRAG